MASFRPNTPVLDSFLTNIVNGVRTQDGQRITDLIQLDFNSLEPNRQKPYSDLNQELNRNFSADNDSGLVDRCKEPLSQDEFGIFSISFSECIIQYFRYLRDFANIDNQTKATRIRQLTSQCVVALGDSTYGIIMLPIVLSFSQVLAVIATNLDRNPALTRNTSLGQAQDTDGTPGKVSFVEDAANVLREAFIKCLAGSPGVSRLSRPTPGDRRSGIYSTADSALRLFMRSRKLRNAQQIFVSIDKQSPPLSFYTAPQRVTYLYYLGRYHFANNHLLRAQKALQGAYEQCHRQARSHRRLILIYLVATNICLGRLPSSELLSRPEAADIRIRFVPLCKIIRSGDLGSFHEYLDLGSESAQWFRRKTVLLQLRNRCEILVWRSLIRLCFVFVGYKGEDKKIPFLRLNVVQHAARWAMKRRKLAQNDFGKPREDYVDPEFRGMNEAFNDTGFDPETGQYHDGANANHTVPDEEPEFPTMHEVESVVLSLIQQGLLGGFALHTNPRFAIPGSGSKGGPLNAGFPGIWSVMSSRADDEQVPGWVEERWVDDTR